MNHEHASDFELTLAAALEIYDAQPPNEQTLRLWWSILQPYPWDLVRAAISDHCSRSKFKPRPADILERLEIFDGRPTPDEAWATALQAQDEDTTVVWTNETAEAWGICRPVLAAGDEIGARRTFIEAYSRLCQEARRRMRPAKWVPSMGRNVEARYAALQLAVDQRRLQQHQVQHLLPLDNPGQTKTEQKLLTGKVTEFPNMAERDARRFTAVIRQGIADAQRIDDKREKQQMQERHEARQQFEDHRASELRRLSSYFEARGSAVDE